MKKICKSHKTKFFSLFEGGIIPAWDERLFNLKNHFCMDPWSQGQTLRVNPVCKKQIFTGKHKQKNVHACRAKSRFVMRWNAFSSINVITISNENCMKTNQTESKSSVIRFCLSFVSLSKKSCDMWANKQSSRRKINYVLLIG